MHESHGGTALLAPPEPPEPERRAPRRAHRGKVFVAALVAAALVLLGTNAAMVYLTHRISLDEQIERVDSVR